MSKVAGTSHRLGRWWLVGGLMVVGALIGLAYGLLRPPVYAAKAYVVAVSSESGGGSTAVSYAQAYARIADQDEVLATAAGNGNATPEELRRSVRASSSPDAPIIEITGSGRPANRAAELANMVANGLIDSANRTSVDTRVRLVLVSSAAPPAMPSAPQPLLDVAVGAAAGLLLGGLALLGRSGRRTEVGEAGYAPADRAGETVEPDRRRRADEGPSIPAPRARPADGFIPDRVIPDLGYPASILDGRQVGFDTSSGGARTDHIYRSTNAGRSDTTGDEDDDPDPAGETSTSDRMNNGAGAGQARRGTSGKPPAQRSSRGNAG